MKSKQTLRPLPSLPSSLSVYLQRKERERPSSIHDRCGRFQEMFGQEVRMKNKSVFLAFQRKRAIVEGRRKRKEERTSFFEYQFDV